MVNTESLKVVQSAKNQERLSITLSLNDKSFSIVPLGLFPVFLFLFLFIDDLIDKNGFAAIIICLANAALHGSL